MIFGHVLHRASVVRELPFKIIDYKLTYLGNESMYCSDVRYFSLGKPGTRKSGRLTLEQQENSIFLYHFLLRFFLLSTNFKPGNINYIVKQIFIGMVKSGKITLCACSFYDNVNYRICYDF